MVSSRSYVKASELNNLFWQCISKRRLNNLSNNLFLCLIFLMPLLYEYIRIMLCISMSAGLSRVTKPGPSEYVCRLR